MKEKQKQVGNEQCNIETQALQVLMGIGLLFISSYLYNGLPFSVLLQIKKVRKAIPKFWLFIL